MFDLVSTDIFIKLCNWNFKSRTKMPKMVLQFVKLKQSIFETLNKKSNLLWTKIGVPQGNILGKVTTVYLYCFKVKTKTSYWRCIWHLSMASLLLKTIIKSYKKEVRPNIIKQLNWQLNHALILIIDHSKHDSLFN